jgi:hypothetical protein
MAPLNLVLANKDNQTDIDLTQLRESDAESASSTIDVLADYGHGSEYETDGN